LLITRDNHEEIECLKIELQKEFEMTDLSKASYYLGTEIHKSKNGIFISQRAYIKKLLQKLDLQDCNPSNLPMDLKIQLQKNTGTSKADTMAYKSLVGSLLYLANTRLNVYYTISCILRYMENPEIAHFQATKKILQYLSGTINYGVFMPIANKNLYHTYVDADWGHDLDTIRSTS